MTYAEVEIDEVCDTGSGGTPSRAKQDLYFGGTIPWVKSGELRESIITHTEESLTEAGLNESAAKLLPKDALLVALYGATVGRVGILGIEAATNQAVCHIIPDSSRLDGRFLFHALRLKVPYWLSQRVGGGQPNISQGVIKKTKIPLPPLPEQKRIAEILDRAEALRAKRRAALALLDELTQSIFLDMFGDPVTNPKGVNVVCLEDVTTRITDGVHQKPNYTESGTAFISVKDITTGTLRFEQCKFISNEDHERFTKRCKAERFDILYTKVGATYGRPAIVETDREFSLYVSVCLIKPNKNLIDPYFLNAALGTSAVKSQADRRIKGIGVPDLHLDQIRKFRIPLPPMPAQQAFAMNVSAVEQLKGAHRHSLQELDQLFASLQHRAFRGEL